MKKLTREIMVSANADPSLHASNGFMIAQEKRSLLQQLAIDRMEMQLLKICCFQNVDRGHVVRMSMVDIQHTAIQSMSAFTSMHVADLARFFPSLYIEYDQEIFR